jgi:hypothetical protein
MIKILFLLILTVTPALAQTNPNFGSTTQTSQSNLNTAFSIKSDLSTTTGSVTNLAALQALPAGQFPSVFRQDAATTYAWSSTQCSITGSPNVTGGIRGDNGFQVAPATGTGCWIAQVNNAPISITLWGADRTGGVDVIPQLTAACSILPGRTFYFPSGVYFVNSSYNQTNVCNVIGDKGAETNPLSLTNQGTWFNITNPAITPFMFGTGAAGSRWANFSVSQAQPAPSTFTGSISGTTLTVPGIVTGPALAVGMYLGGTGGTAIPAGTYISAVNSSTSYTLTYAAATTLTIGTESMSAWKPTLYNSSIFQISNVYGGPSFDNIMFYGVYRGFSIYNSGRSNIRNVSGQFFNTGIYYDNDQDTSFVDNFKVWPFWSVDPSVVSYSQYNGDAIVSGRHDTPMWGKIHVLGMKSALHLVSTPSGVTSGLTIDQIDGDDNLYTLMVDNNNTTAMIGKMYSAGGGIPNSEVIYIGGAFNTIDLGETNMGNVGCAAVDVYGATGGNIIRASTMTLTNINQNPSGCTQSAIRIINATTPNSFTMPIQPSLLSYAGSIYAINNQISPSTTNAVIDVPITAPWTATIQGSGGTGTSTYTTRYGDYTVKGNQVTVNFTINISGAFSGYSGTISIGGLPYSAVGTSAGYGCQIYYYASITPASGNTGVTGTISAGGSQIVLTSVGGSTAPSLINASQIGSNPSINGTCTYMRN